MEVVGLVGWIMIIGEVLLGRIIIGMLSKNKNMYKFVFSWVLGFLFYVLHFLFVIFRFSYYFSWVST